MTLYHALMFQPSRGDQTWRPVPLENGLAGRSEAIAELVRHAMRIDEERATEFLARILDGQVDLEEPLHFYDPFLSAKQDEAWLCIVRNEAGAAEPPLPQPTADPHLPTSPATQ